MNSTKLGNISGISITGGQIMNRVISAEEGAERIPVLHPKYIREYETVTREELPTEPVREFKNESRIVKEGDLVMKLSTPFDVMMAEKGLEGALIPSFCVIIRLGNDAEVDPSFLLAYLNSAYCRNQLAKWVTGSTAGLLSVGKLKELDVFLPDRPAQESVSKAYRALVEKKRLIRKIERLEEEKMAEVVRKAVTGIEE